MLKPFPVMGVVYNIVLPTFFPVMARGYTLPPGSAARLRRLLHDTFMAQT